MARVCTVCGKGPTTGNHVSHANNRVKSSPIVGAPIARMPLGTRAGIPLPSGSKKDGAAQPMPCGAR